MEARCVFLTVQITHDIVAVYIVSWTDNMNNYAAWLKTLDGRFVFSRQQQRAVGPSSWVSPHWMLPHNLIEKALAAVQEIWLRRV